MALQYSGVVMGTLQIEREYPKDKTLNQRYTIELRQSNALACFIHSVKITEGIDKGKYQHTLYQFYADEQHLKNLAKHDNMFLGDKVLKIRLNLAFKECKTLLKYYTQAGYKVECYYKMPNGK